MNIRSREIGQGDVYFIAEAGVNHNGDLILAKELVDIAAEAGADAVKFQTYNTDEVMTAYAPTAEYQHDFTGAGRQKDMAADLELTEAEFRSLHSYTERHDLDFLSTPFDFRSVDFLDELDIPAFKVGSGELTNTPLLKYIAGKGRPMIVSTGMATLAEVEQAADTIRDTDPAVPFALLHCTSVYPTSIDDVNLRSMNELDERFAVPVGLSDHTTEIETPALAVAAGATIVEKHFTLDPSLDGPDHAASLAPDELERAIDLVRVSTRALGSGTKEPVTAEADIRPLVRKSLHAVETIEPGEPFTAENVAIKRPADGLEPSYYEAIRGKMSRSSLSHDDPITEDDVDVDRSHSGN